MKIVYFDDDDTLVIRLSDKPVVREVSQDCAPMSATRLMEAWWKR